MCVTRSAHIPALSSAGATGSRHAARSRQSRSSSASTLALQSVIFTSDGWACVAYFGGEVRDSARAIPRSLLGSVAMIIAIYLLVNMALLRIVPLQQLAGDKLAVGTASTVVFGAHGGTV